MMTNIPEIYHYLLSFLILSGWILVDYLTGQKTYYEATVSNIDINLQKNRIEKFNQIYLIYIVLMFFVNSLSMSVFKDYIHSPFWSAPAIMTTLLVGMGFASLYTDPPLHRVNRHSLRYVYIVNLLLTLGYSLTIKNGIEEVFVTTVMVYGVCLFFLLFTFMMGASDLRAIMGLIPLYLIIFNKFTIPVLIVHFIGIGIGHFIQKRKTKKSVPICHWLIIPVPFIVVSFVLLAEQYPELVKLTEVNLINGLSF